jgi:hypothetical protein
MKTKEMKTAKITTDYLAELVEFMYYEGIESLMYNGNMVYVYGDGTYEVADELEKKSLN